MQGQCGSGQALEEIAKQQRQEWQQLADADKTRPMSSGYPSGPRGGNAGGAILCSSHPFFQQANL